jgi:LuxR family transcriptional regulator, glucitol operon activator
MEDASTAARLSCYALISALETDLRRWLSDAFVSAGISDFLHTDLKKAAIDRRSRDPNAVVESPSNDYNLVDYLDFGDLGKLIFQHLNVLPSNSAITAKDVAHNLETLIPVRNRVCHSRPLELEDFSTVADAASKFVQTTEIDWRDLRLALRTLKQKPASVLSLSIPEYWTESTVTIQNNLPLPDFEDTGFVGRANDISQVTRNLLGPYPVISIIGEGGLGKTALALKVLYELLDDPRAQSRFDIICWISLKTSKLTAAGILEIKGALTSTLQLFQHVARDLGAPELQIRSMADALREVLDYMQEFRVLLAIDNLETVGHSDVVEFLRELPEQSKILITSRIGMGQIEFPYPLVPLEVKDASHLLRRAARAQNISVLVQAKQERVERWCRRLHFNPLAIKWFVSAVALGKEPDDLVNPSGQDYRQLLKFSFDNLYSRLSDEAKQLVHLLSLVGSPATRTEISLIFAAVSPSLTQDGIDTALILLHNASVIRRQLPREADVSTSGPRYSLTDFAAQFVRQLETAPRSFASRVQQALKKVRDISETSAHDIRYYKYQWRVIRAKSKEERLVRSIIMQAMKAYERGQMDAALSQLESADRLMSGFSEIHRIRAFFLSKSGDLAGAREEYDRALECDPASEITRYCYAGFLVHEVEDYDAAFQVIEKVVQNLPNDFPPRSLLALIETRRGNFQSATDIYESLLKSFGDEQLTKHRISLRSQAAEAYRRWAEKHLAYREPVHFRHCISRSLEIVLDGLQSDESDWRLERTLGQVCSEGMYGYSTLRDESGASELLRLLQRFQEYLPATIEIRTSKERFLAAFRHIPDFADMFVALPLRSVETASERATERREEHRLVGQVRNISAVGDYGFIVTADGERWFFHRNHLQRDEDWSRMIPGQHCTFAIGANARGACAIEVQATSD